jgi:hypothetical protein
MSGFSALVLAGSRPGPDPWRKSPVSPPKFWQPLAESPCCCRVIALLRAAEARASPLPPRIRRVVTLARSLGCEVIEPPPTGRARAPGAASLLGAPMLLTTADHALLEGEWITDFRAAIAPQTDVAVLLARRDVVEACPIPGAPGCVADGQWSGCNLFHFATPRAAAAFSLWQAVERDRKHPWRIVRRLGPGCCCAIWPGASRSPMPWPIWAARRGRRRGRGQPAWPRRRRCRQARRPDPGPRGSRAISFRPA